MARLPIIPQPTAIQTRIHLPPLANANAGQYYDAPFAAPDIIDVVLPADSGLAWANGCLYGTPTQAGEILLNVHVRTASGMQQASHVLHVNPDPRSLWKNLPSDGNDPFHKPDNAHQQLNSAHGRLLAARVRGRGHAHAGGFCDDDFRLAVHEATGAHMLAIADGAGSAAYSRLGSQLAVNAAVDAILALLDNREQHGKLAHIAASKRRAVVENLFDHAVYHALRSQEKALAEHAQLTDIKSLSSTLLIAFSLPCADGHWLTAAYGIGDGALALCDEHGFRRLGQADSGTYAGETQFLSHDMRTEKALAARTVLHESRQAPLLLLLTDGVSDAKFASDAALSKAENWQALWNELQTPLAENTPAAALEHWLGFWSPGNHDDRTIALFIPGIAP